MIKDYPLYEAHQYRTMMELVTTLSERYGDHPAVVCFDRRGNPLSYSYATLARDSLALARALRARGFAGRHIAIASENGYLYLVCFFGIIISGNVAVTIDIEQSADTIATMLSISDCSAVFASASVYEICRNANSSRSVLSMDSGDGESAVSLIAAFAEDERDLPQTDEHAVCMIVFTSGTSSSPKPVMHSQYGLLKNVYESVTLIHAEPRIFSGLPFYHLYGLACFVLSNLQKGITLGINSNLRTFMRDFSTFQPGSLMAVPLMMEALYKKIWDAIELAGKKPQVKRLVRLYVQLDRLGIHKKSKILLSIKQRALGDLQTVCCGGAHISKQILEELNAFGVLVMEGYGITECAPLLAVARNRQYLFSSVGKLLSGYEIRFEDGEIVVRGESVMKGYYGDPKTTAECIRDGWFYTGDLGRLDRHGFLYITGRKKNLIVLKNGKKISPEEVEATLSDIPLIGELVAYGVPSGQSADDVKLAVMIYPDPERTAGMSRYEILSALQEAVDEKNKALPIYRQVQMINIRDQAFSKTTSRKIKRDTL